jgi:hypothetical protein
MRRFEQITGRRLSETEDISILWLALYAYEILHLKEPHASPSQGYRDPGTPRVEVLAGSDGRKGA